MVGLSWVTIGQMPCHTKLCLWASLLTEIGNYFMHNMFLYIQFILYLRSDNATLATLCMGLPITITIASKSLNSLTIHDNNKCITPNGQAITNVGAEKYVTVQLFYLLKYSLELLCKSLFIYTYGFGQPLWLNE